MCNIYDASKKRAKLVPYLEITAARSPPLNFNFLVAADVLQNAQYLQEQVDYIQVQIDRG